MYIYEFYLTQCLKISVIIYNIDNIHINRQKSNNNFLSDDGDLEIFLDQTEIL